MTYLFYDIETTGLNPAFDQILQFAAVRTDMTLAPIERHNLMVRLRPDVVPSPAAMLTHGIGLDRCQQGIGELEAVGRIHRMVNTPGTISIGYNSMGFDDEFLRFAFYRNLLPPYTHQYKNGCQRMDLLPIAIIYRLFRPEVLNWPQVNGKGSLKLERLSQANHLAEGPSHDAAVDVDACVGLARRLQADPQVWNYVAGAFHKATDEARADALVAAHPQLSQRLALLVAHDFGAEMDYQAPAIAIGPSIPYANQSLWLRLDKSELPTTTPSNVADTTWVVRKKWGEPPLVLPPLERYWSRLAEPRRRLVGDNLNWLAAHPEVLGPVIDYHANYRYPPVEGLDTDAALYEAGFWSDGDQDLCRRFHRADMAGKAQLVGRFASEQLNELAARVVMRNAPEALTPELARRQRAYWKKINPGQGHLGPPDYRGRRRTTAHEAMAEIKRLRAEPATTGQAKGLLDELEDYIRGRFGDGGLPE